MAQALASVQAVPEDKGLRSSYGGLCHKLPALILKNGLCQTVAFLGSKSAGDGAQAQAHRLVLDHLAATLGPTAQALPGYVSSVPLEEYMRATRTTLLAWTFYKRFAVSLLGVEPAEEGGETE